LDSSGFYQNLLLTLTIFKGDRFGKWIADEKIAVERIRPTRSGGR
jgi:hypothetical protein